MIIIHFISLHIFQTPKDTLQYIMNNNMNN